MTKTVKEQFDDCKRVTEVIDNANALLTKCQDELKTARSVLEALVEYQHPKLSMQIPYSLRSARDDAKHSPAQLIKLEIGRINELLGDRA